jgi:hypothetical protein
VKLANHLTIVGTGNNVAGSGEIAIRAPHGAIGSCAGVKPDVDEVLPWPWITFQLVLPDRSVAGATTGDFSDVSARVITRNGANRREIT